MSHCVLSCFNTHVTVFMCFFASHRHPDSKVHSALCARPWNDRRLRRLPRRNLSMKSRLTFLIKIPTHTYTHKLQVSDNRGGGKASASAWEQKTLPSLSFKSHNIIAVKLCKTGDICLSERHRWTGLGLAAPEQELCSPQVSQWQFWMKSTHKRTEINLNTPIEH